MADHSENFPPSGAWAGDDGCASWDNDGQSSSAAQEGTKRHALLLDGWLTWRVSRASDKGPWTWPTSIGIDDDANEGAKISVQVTGDDVRACQALMPYLDKHPAVVNYGKPGYMVWIEELVDYGAALGRRGQGFFGHCDIILLTPRCLEIMDAKFGRKIVSPEKPQLKLYGLGAGGIVYSPEFAAHAQQLATVKLTIGQPENPKGPIQSWEGPIASLITWRDEAIKWVAAREGGKGRDFNPSDSNCHFCLHRNNCAGRMNSLASMLDGARPATAATGGPVTQKVNPWSVVPWGKVNSENVSPEDLAHAKLSAQNLARDVIIDASHAPAAPTAPAPLAPAEQIASLAETHAGREVKEIADDELAKLLDIAGQFKAFLADVEAEAKRRLMAGGLQGRGWKMVAGKRARKLKVDEDELVLTLRETWKLPKDDVRDKDGNITKQGVMQTKLKSLAQLDGVVSNLSKARQKKFAEMWEWRTGPPVLAPESDPADAVNPRPELLDGADEDPSENTVNVGNALTPEQAAAGSAPMEDPPSWY